jgi:DNA-binding response OmpR family regulator
VVAADQNVLVVDDDAPIRMLCRVNLELDGFRVVEAATFAEARDALESEPVDLIVLDLHVAGEHGTGFLEELRADWPQLPVMLMTGSVDVAELAGPERVLSKPFDPEALTRMARELTLDTKAHVSSSV